MRVTEDMLAQIAGMNAPDEINLAPPPRELDDAELDLELVVFFAPDAQHHAERCAWVARLRCEPLITRVRVHRDATAAAALAAASLAATVASSSRRLSIVLLELTRQS